MDGMIHGNSLEGVVVWIVFGLIVGIVAKFIMPGRESGGFLVTMLLGIAGALVGGVIGRMLGFYGAGNLAGFVMAVLGAMLLLFLDRMVRSS